MPVSFLHRKSTADPQCCRFRRSPRVLVTLQADEAVLFDTVRDRYFTLNGVGACVWASLEQPSTLADLVAVVCRDYDVPREDRDGRVSRDVSDLLGQLNAAGLILAAPIPHKFPHAGSPCVAR